MSTYYPRPPTTPVPRGHGRVRSSFRNNPESSPTRRLSPDTPRPERVNPRQRQPTTLPTHRHAADDVICDSFDVAYRPSTPIPSSNLDHSTRRNGNGSPCLLPRLNSNTNARILTKKSKSTGEDSHLTLPPIGGEPNRMDLSPMMNEAESASTTTMRRPTLMKELMTLPKLADLKPRRSQRNLQPLVSK